MKGLIEEAQVLANRMETALWSQKDYRQHLPDQIRTVKTAIKDLEKKKERLDRTVARLEEKVKDAEEKTNQA